MTNFLINNSIFVFIAIIVLGMAALAKIVLKLANYSENRSFDDLDRVNDDVYHLEQQRNQLRQEVADLQAQLLRLSENTLQPELEDALDMYEQSNIRIPADIIEDASVLTFPSVKSALNFIETQRVGWKQENMKKVYKG